MNAQRQSTLAAMMPPKTTPSALPNGMPSEKSAIAPARWLATTPSLLILDEPTQGIDVGSKAEIHRLMGDLAARGLGILMISSDLAEVLGMSDRIVVMREGRTVGELPRAEATAERVMALAATAA